MTPFDLAELLFPDVTTTPEEVEARFPLRSLPEGAKVTRVAPSPTGFVHFGTLFPAFVSERLAHQSGGVFYLRIEDTDSLRYVPGAEQDLIDTLSYYGIHFDEGPNAQGENGAYGPYWQSKRRDIYHVFAKQLVREGKAYPYFPTDAEMSALKQVNKKEENKTKDWAAEAEAAKAAQEARRTAWIDTAEAAMAASRPFVLYIRADGDGEKKVFFTDLIKGKLEFPENDEDFVLLKSDGIPTYHFAHAVDDHLMRTTTVVRGEEWLPSLPKHLQLFRYLGFKPLKYLHIAQLMRMEGNSKKKLSKRDRGAALADYKAMGYPRLSVIEYVFTLLNSNYEEWRRGNGDKSWEEFPFSVKKMSVSGALFDFDKLNDVSKNVISRMTAEEVYDGVLAWAKEYDGEFAALLSAQPETAKAAFAIGRGGNKPRKDLTVWADAKEYMGFFFDSLYRIQDPYPDTFQKSDIRAALEAFMASYDPSDDQQTWFDKVKEIAAALGFAPDMKMYKASPEEYKGHIGDVSMFLRVAVTGKMNAPDLYAVMQILGRDITFARLQHTIQTILS